MSRGELNISRWLEAHSDRSSNLTVLPRNLTLADVSGDGDHRLLLTDLKLEPATKSRLKVYRGTVLTSDQALPDLPSGLISFYTDDLEPRIPGFRAETQMEYRRVLIVFCLVAVAVACGTDLLIYKNNKPYFKFSLPVLVVTALEKEVWRKYREEPGFDFEKGLEDLKGVAYSGLSARSQQLLNLERQDAEEFIKRHVGCEPMKHSVITCLAVLNKSSPEQNAVACPVVGTEAGHIYVLDPQIFSILHQASVCSTKATPFIIRCSGLFDVEFRIVIACREDCVCILRRGWLEGKTIIQTTANIVDFLIIPGDNFIVIATIDKQLHCYTKRGNRLWTTQTNQPITCLCLIPLKHHSLHLVAVGLKGGSIQLYQGRQGVDYVTVSDSACAIIFGQLGQEEHVLIVITSAGTLNFKILKRTADFSISARDASISPLQQNKPLPLPKRSKLFLEQSLRERQNPVEMHQSFQQDLVRLRLAAARALVQNLSDQTGVGNEKEQLKVSAQVLGLGPKFSLILAIENMNSEAGLLDLFVVFHADVAFYKLSCYYVKIPLVPPGLSHKVAVNVEDLKTNLEEEKNQIKVFVVKKGQTRPLVAANVTMPATDAL